jgi:gluconokinase
MTKFMLGLDLGTTSTKAIALSPGGDLLATASAPNRIYSNVPGSAWQDPREVCRGALKALTDLSQKIPMVNALGICLSGAMHSLFPCGPDLEPLMPATTWADVRAGETAERMRSMCNPAELYRRTGCPLQYLYHPAKIRRWIDENPDLGAAQFSAIKDYVLFKLTGEWVTDLSLASATGLLDTHQYFCWDQEAIALAGIQPGQLPVLISPDSVAGKITRAAAELTGLPIGLPVIAGAGDGGLANLGSGAVHNGQTVLTIGTSGAVRRIAGQPQFDPAERTWCYLLLPGRWFHGGATNNAGLAVQWVRDQFYPDLPGTVGYDQLFTDAAAVDVGADGVVVAPYFAGERNPHWDAGARAAIHGLAFEHGRKQVARAVLEGVGFCMADIWDAMGENPLPGGAVRLTGMINSRPIWAQILADQIGVSLEGLEAGDASAVGAAMMGFSSLSPGSSLESLAALSRPTAFYAPDSAHHAAYQRIKRNFRAIYSIRRAQIAAV